MNQLHVVGPILWSANGQVQCTEHQDLQLMSVHLITSSVWCAGGWHGLRDVEPMVNSIFFLHILEKTKLNTKIITNQNNASPPAKKIKTVSYSYVFRLQNSLYLNSFQIMSKIMMSVFILAMERCSLFISYYSQGFFFFFLLISWRFDPNKMLCSLFLQHKRLRNK